MKLPDANLLLYAYDTDGPFQAEAAAWLSDQLSSDEPLRFAVVTLVAFIRLSSDRRIYSAPLAPREASAVVEGWLRRPNVDLLHPLPGHWDALGALAEKAGLAGPPITDVHRAQLAIEHDATLYSADKGFRRFPGLRFVNPLEPTP